MKTIPSALEIHLQGAVTTLAVCWQVFLNDGTYIRGTEHDRDLVIASSGVGVDGTYNSLANIMASVMKAGSDGTPDNMEVTGAIPTVSHSFQDVTVAMIESGLLDLAQVTIFLVNWINTSNGVTIIRAGRLGNLSRDSDGQYNLEIRGMAQYLSQQIGYTYSVICNVVTFGDSRCKFNVAGATRTANITTVTDQKNIVVTITSGGAPPVPTYFNRSIVKFTSGLNNNFTREVKNSTVNIGGTINLTFYDEAPLLMSPGDTISLPPGCDRAYTTCKNTFNNLINRRAYGDFTPGMDALLKGPL